MEAAPSVGSTNLKRKLHEVSPPLGVTAPPPARAAKQLRRSSRLAGPKVLRRNPRITEKEGDSGDKPGEAPGGRGSRKRRAGGGAAADKGVSSKRPRRAAEAAAAERPRPVESSPGGKRRAGGEAGDRAGKRPRPTPGGANSRAAEDQAEREEAVGVQVCVPPRLPISWSGRCGSTGDWLSGTLQPPRLKTLSVRVTRRCVRHQPVQSALP